MKGIIPRLLFSRKKMLALMAPGPGLLADRAFELATLSACAAACAVPEPLAETEPRRGSAI
jgi:hypothetical protein